jgi:hypothetical protein
MKKTAIAAALLAATSTVHADILTFDWTGAFTMINPSGDALANGDFGANSTSGFRTELTGTMEFNTFTGAGTATVAPFNFFGGGPAAAHDITMQAIGAGDGINPGNLVAGTMLFDWSGNNNISVDIVLDAGGFFTSGIVDPLGNYTGAVAIGGAVVKGPAAVSPDTETSGGMCASVLASVYCVVAFDDPATATATSYVIPSSGISYNIFPSLTVIDGGPQLMSTVDGNPFDHTVSTITQAGPDGILGTADDVVWTGERHNDGLSGIRMDNGPFPGFNANFDVRTMTLTDVSQVPVPAAVWLFGSGLLGLVGVARRKAA